MLHLFNTAAAPGALADRLQGAKSTAIWFGEHAQPMLVSDAGAVAVLKASPDCDTGTDDAADNIAAQISKRFVLDIQDGYEGGQRSLAVGQREVFRMNDSHRSKTFKGGSTFSASERCDDDVLFAFDEELNQPQSNVVLGDEDDIASAEEEDVPLFDAEDDLTLQEHTTGVGGDLIHSTHSSNDGDRCGGASGQVHADDDLEEVVTRRMAAPNPQMAQDLHGEENLSLEMFAVIEDCGASSASSMESGMTVIPPPPGGASAGVKKKKNKKKK